MVPFSLRLGVEKVYSTHRLQKIQDDDGQNAKLKGLTKQSELKTAGLIICCHIRRIVKKLAFLLNWNPRLVLRIQGSQIRFNFIVFIDGDNQRNTWIRENAMD